MFTSYLVLNTKITSGAIVCVQKSERTQTVVNGHDHEISFLNKKSAVVQTSRRDLNEYQ